MPYRHLNEETCSAYIRSVGIFPEDAQVTCREVGDGNINLVFILKNESAGKSVVIKQALPYVRCVGESWPLDLGRTIREGKALEIQNRLAPGLVPEVFRVDPELALIVMEDLSHLGVMRPGMIQMKSYPLFADHISTLMANLGFFTSDLYMDPGEKKELVKEFINPELCKITEDLIFTDPYYDCERNNVNPALRPYLEKVFWRKTALRLEASKFKYKFLTEAQSLMHGDLHTGSIFADAEHTKAFDPEFAYYGPTAFDTGSLIGNFIINFFSWDGKDNRPEDVRNYRSYLLESVNDIYTMFERKFLENWEKCAKDLIAGVPGYREFYMRNMFLDTVGFAALIMIRRMHGLAHNIDVDGIPDLGRRSEVQIRILEMGEQLIMNRNSFHTIKDVTEFIRQRAF